MKKNILGLLLFVFGNSFSQTQPLFYGMTTLGGTNFDGNIFSYNPSSSTYIDCFDFSGSNGQYPYGSLMQASNGKLYGMTRNGGTLSHGTLFSFDPTNSSFTDLVNFNGINGQQAYGSLIQASDGKLYGMTKGGTYGNIFSYDPVNLVFTDLVHFNDTNGFNPVGALLQASDGKLYGLTSGGVGGGSIFSYDILSSSFNDLHDFTILSQGSYPNGDLTEVDLTLGETDISNSDRINSFPNPFDQSTTLTFPSSISRNEIEIVLTDLQGRIVQAEKTPYTNTFTLQRGNLETGIYFCTVKSDGKNVGVKKIIVK